MAVFNTSGVEIIGMSCAVPDNYVPEETFIKRFGEETVAKFMEGTGIHSIYNAFPEQTAGDLAYAAAEDLFAKVEMDRMQIGAMVFVTQSPDYRRPSTACVLQNRLQLSLDCACTEVALGCSGFIYGLQTVLSMLDTSDTEYGLLLIGETASKLVNPMDKSIVMMYGDAGAAILLKKNGDQKITTLLKSDGYRYKAIVLPAGGFRDMNPDHETFMCSDGNERSLYDIFMDGMSVFSFSITDVPKTIKEYLKITDTVIDEYDVVALHQANYFMLKQIIRRIKADPDRVPISLDRFGNTGGISIPLTLCDTFGANSDGENKRILMCGFGIGLSWGVTSMKINTAFIHPIVRTSDYYKDGKFIPGKY